MVVGTNTLQVDMPGYPTEIITATVPEVPVLTRSLPATAASGTSLTVEWTRDPRVALYEVDVFTLEDFRWLFHATTTDTSVVTGPLVHTGQVRVNVTGMGQMAVGSNGGFILPSNLFATTIDFTP